MLTLSQAATVNKITEIQSSVVNSIYHELQMDKC